MKVYVCVGSACHLKGSYEVVQGFKQLIEEHNVQDDVQLSASFCLGHCSKEGVSVKIEDDVFNVKIEELPDFFKKNVLARLG